MVREKGKAKVIEQKKPEEPARVGFLVWFSEALEKCNQLKPHHMSSIQAYFGEIGLSEPHTAEAYYDALRGYGFGRDR